jgi:hypothetical protein
MLGVGRKLRNLYLVYLVVHVANLQKSAAYTNTQAIELMQERVVVTRHYVPAHPDKLLRVNQMGHRLSPSLRNAQQGAPVYLAPLEN